MRPVEPRTLRLLVPARAALAVVTASGVLAGILVVAQAFAVTALVVAVVDGTGWHAAGWALAALTAARTAAGTVSERAAAQAAGRVSTGLRVDVVRAGLAHPDRADEIGLLATRGVAAVEPYLTRFLPTLVVAAVLPALTVATIVVLDVWAGVIVLATLPLVPVFAALIGLATRDRAERQYRSLTLLAGHFLDVVRGLPTLVTFNRAEHQSARIREVTDRYRRRTVETLRIAFASSAALELVATLSVALVAVSVGLRLADGGISLRTALVVLLLAPEAYWPLRRVGAEFHAAAEGATTLTRIADLLSSGAPRPRVLADPLDDSLVDPVPIVVTDLVAGYPSSTGPALVLPHAVVPAPGLTAITGPSGCGKSTLVRVLAGELAPTGGSVTLAGEPIDPEEFRTVLAQVPQRPWLTAGTIAENLRIGRPDAAEDRLWAVLDEVALSEVVAALPQGLHTRLGEDGAGLSAGERARLALARVVLADRPYVVLDEPSAHLDPVSEQVLLATITRLAQHASVVVVAHSRAVVDVADRVIGLSTPPVPVAPPAAPAARPPVRHREPEVGERESGRRRRPMLVATLLSIAASLSGVALTATAGWLIVRAADRPPVLALMVAIVGVRTFGLARPVLRYAERLVSHDAALRQLAETRARVYDVLVPLAPACFGRRRGDLLASVVDDVDAELDDRLRVRLPVRTWLGVAVVSTVLVALVLPWAGLVVAALAFGAGALALGVSRLGAGRAEADLVELRAAVSATVVTTLQDARQLVAWQAEQRALADLGRQGDRLGRAGRRSAAALTRGRALLTLATGAAVLAMAGVLDAGPVSGPVAALLVLVPLALAEVLAPLPDASALAVRTAAARARLDELARTEPAVHEPGAPLPPSGEDIALVDVTVRWNDLPALSGLDGRIPVGTSLGITGPSGSGKSTLAALLVRHLEPSSGTYRLGIRDVADLASSAVRERIVLVDDDPYVFASDVRENLRLARPGASDVELVTALDAVGLRPWLATLTDGLDTLLGAGGADVSGGERARIGIARALLADPAVLVLDEPTAHLDSTTASAVSATLRANWDGRTMVWISHRPEDLAGLDATWTLSSRPSPGSAHRDSALPGTSPRCPGSPPPGPRRSRR